MHIRSKLPAASRPLEECMDWPRPVPRARASRWRRESPESGSTPCRGAAYTAATSRGPPFEGAPTTREPLSSCAQIILRTWFTVRACKKLPSDHKLQARQVPRRLRFPFLFRRLLGWVGWRQLPVPVLKALGGGLGGVLGSGGAGLACWVPVGCVSRPRSEGLLLRTGDAMERSNRVSLAGTLNAGRDRSAQQNEEAT